MALKPIRGRGPEGDVAKPTDNYKKATLVSCLIEAGNETFAFSELQWYSLSFEQYK